jgi:SAM-dependent methyltransferase
MDDTLEPRPDTRPKLLVDLGSGMKGTARLPAMFAEWRHLRIDSDAGVAPDLLADVTDLSAIESGSADAVWSAHCFEHLYLFEVGQAITEAYRILNDDGFLCAIVPDLQAIAEYIVADQLHQAVDESPAGPVIAHDVIFGYGPHLAQGHFELARKCGFTPNLLLEKVREAPFADIMMQRRQNRELVVVACKKPPADDAEREALLTALEL